MSILRDLKQPFNLVMLLLAIGALAVAGYAYYYPRTDKTVSYLATQPARIFDSKNATPKIRLLDATNTPITTDTYVATVTLWNSGSQPIEPTEVRKPLRVLVTADRLLDYAITKEKDRSVSAFGLTAVEGAAAKTQGIELHWTHFDPRHGLTLQVIYSTADTNPKVWLETEISGLESLRDARSLATRYSWLPLIMVIILGLGGGIVFGGIWDWIPRFGSALGRILARLAVSAALIGTVWLIVRTLFSNDAPPF